MKKEQVLDTIQKGKEIIPIKIISEPKFDWEPYVLLIATLSLIAAVIIPFAQKWYEEYRTKRSFQFYFKKQLGIKDNVMMWLYGTGGGKIKIKCKYSLRVDEHSVFLPQNFSGIWSGESLVDRYPAGTAPHGLGENSTQVTSYGFDQQTACPETKCSLVRIERA